MDGGELIKGFTSGFTSRSVARRGEIENLPVWKRSVLLLLVCLRKALLFARFLKFSTLSIKLFSLTLFLGAGVPLQHLLGRSA